jgi:8-amino-7-oxononanoate synthase
MHSGAVKEECRAANVMKCGPEVFLDQRKLACRKDKKNAPYVSASIAHCSLLARISLCLYPREECDEAGQVMLNKALQAALDRRRQKGTLRRLTSYETTSDAALAASSTPTNSPSSSSSTRSALIDFSSNDYMGLGHSQEMRSRLIAKMQDSARFPLGSTGSRLLDGNSSEHEQLEERLAHHLGAECALLFNSGFDANSSILATLPQPGDYILYDSLIHASAHDGMRASRTAKENRFAFLHNDLDDVARLLQLINTDPQASTSNVFLVVESVYSMDGDTCPLRDLTELVDSFLPRERRCIIVDEAHAVGLYGLNGAGLADELGVRDHVDIRLATFGKAFGCSGAAVLCTPLIREFLINYARPLIYSTAIPHSTLLSVHSALDILATPNGALRAAKTFTLTHSLIDGLHKILSQQQKGSSLLLLPAKPGSLPLAPIVPLISSHSRALATHLIQSGYLVRPIVYPTVPKGSERVRICVHSHNETQDVVGLLDSIQQWLQQQQEQLKCKM